MEIAPDAYRQVIDNLYEGPNLVDLKRVNTQSP